MAFHAGQTGADAPEVLGGLTSRRALAAVVSCSTAKRCDHRRARAISGVRNEPSKGCAIVVTAAVREVLEFVSDNLRVLDPCCVDRDDLDGDKVVRVLDIRVDR